MEWVFFGLLGLAFLFSGVIALVMTLGQRERLQRLEKRLELLGDVSNVAGMNAALTNLTRRMSALEAAPPQTRAQAAEPLPALKTVQEIAADETQTAALETAALPAALEAPAAAFEPAPAQAAVSGIAALEAPPAQAAVPKIAAPAASAAAAPPAPKPPKRGFEDRFGTQWTVWAGALALAFGAIFLVRYSIEQGYFGPAGRIAAGVIFSAVLLAAGEWLRRRDAAYAFTALPQPSVPALLTAAGTIAAFATLYAAHALYGMIGPALGFALLGAAAILTMAASAIHGPSLAALGLAGSLAVPMLVQSQRSEGWALMIYLAVTAGAAYAVSQWRGWRWLAIAAAAGIAAWTLLIQLRFGLILRWHVLIQTLLAAAAFAALPWRAAAADAKPDPLASAILGGAAAFGFAASVIWGGFSWPWAAVFIAVQLGLAALVPGLALSAAFSGALVAATLLAWPPLASEGGFPGWAWFLEALNPDRQFFFKWLEPAARGEYLMFAVIASAAAAAAGLAKLWRGRALPLISAGACAFAAIATPVLALAVAWARLDQLMLSWRFAGAAALLAAGFAALSLQFLKRAESAAARLAAEAFAAGSVLAAAIALTMALNRGTLTVAVALTAAAAAFFAAKSPLNWLRYAIGALGLIVLARTARDPGLLRDDVGGTPVFNWLLFTYGLPAVSFFAAGKLLGAKRLDWPAEVMQALSILFAALLIVFEIRHWFHSGDILAGATSHFELGLQATVSLAMAAALTRLDTFNESRIFRFGAMALGAASAAAALLGLMLFENPLFWGSVQGNALINTLLPGYALPAAAAFGLGSIAQSKRGAWFTAAARGLGAALALAFVMLEIRRLYQGPVMLIDQGFAAGELGVHTAVLLAAAALLAGLPVFNQHSAFRIGEFALAAAAAAAAFLGLMLADNPLFGGSVQGNALINSLLPGYALPAAAAFGLAWIVKSRRGGWFALAALGLGAALGFLWSILAVRRLYQGPDLLLDKGFGDAELWTYSALWLAAGGALLALGILRQSRTLRLISAALVAVTVLKVFLIDMRGLTGAWRALSFIGLGGALMGIGLAYQRLVFNKPGKDDERPA